MRGQAIPSSARLGSLPARERLAAWADVRIRKRRSEHAREAVLMAGLANERRLELRRAWGRAGVAVRRLPY